MVNGAEQAGGWWLQLLVGNTFGGQIMVSSGRIFFFKKKIKRASEIFGRLFFIARAAACSGAAQDKQTPPLVSREKW
jgi:hypothetical protein